MSGLVAAPSDALMRAVVIRAFGGPEVLRPEYVPRPATAPGSTLIRVARAGVNYFDTERRASWRASELPVILGGEVAGRRLSDGQRVVGLIESGIGGYAEYAAVPSEFAVPIPDAVSDSAALAVLVQGLTAWYLLVKAARVESGESVVVTAAAGGVGSLAVQIATWFGATRVIAIASTEAKRRSALELGADAALDSAPVGLAERVRLANGGAGVDLVLESVAGPIVDALLDALATGGRLVAYGQASGSSNTVSVDRLMNASIGVLGFWLTPYLADRVATRRVIETLLAAVAEGRLRVREGPSFLIAHARHAHELIGAGASAGKVTLAAGEAGWAGR